MKTFRQDAIPVHNYSDEAIDLLLEPEGEAVLIPPNATAFITIEDEDGEDGDVDGVEFVYKSGKVLFYAWCRKCVTIKGP